jgi:FlaA1/EpsC-like NDP-sugar epimerase
MVPAGKQLMENSWSEFKTNLIVRLNLLLERLVNVLFPRRTFLIVIANLFTVIVSFLLAFYVRFIEGRTETDIEAMQAALIIVIIVKPAIFILFRLYNVMWRYVSISDIIRIFYANLVGSILVAMIILPLRGILFPSFSTGVIVIDFIFCFLLMSGKKVVLRIIREEAMKAAGEQTIRTLVVGNTATINGVLQAFASAPSKRKIVGVLCDEMKTGQTIRGIPVLGQTRSTAKCARKHDASEILLLPPFSSPSHIHEIMEELEQREYTCDLRMVPAYIDIASGNISVSQIREVEIEDLLGRKPVKLDRTDVAEFVRGKVVMVTGAGGSIGTELCRQLASYRPEKMVLFELSEFNLYQVMQQIQERLPETKLIGIIGDVRSEANLNRALDEHRIDILYHAAAYKHVPIMEENPGMAFETNILGTANVASCAERHKVRRMVMISTDKAVRPTSIMGAAKRIAERVILERSEAGTEFVVVRFGNVLGSSGSVIPLFREQIRRGGPVTVTSENVIRYFMSIPEAVDLVLQAGVIGKDRDIMVLEMGKPVRIYDMAKKLIELSGFIPNKDIEIRFTGLRPGEKEYEELLTSEEKVIRTPYDRIYVARKEETSAPSPDLEEVAKTVLSHEPAAFRTLIDRYIPENLFPRPAPSNS